MSSVLTCWRCRWRPRLDSVDTSSAQRRPRHKNGARQFDVVSTLHYKVLMKAIMRTVAIIELVLVFPAVLFMTALFVRL
jgi:hypothetical protein